MPSKPPRSARAIRRHIKNPLPAKPAATCSNAATTADNTPQRLQKVLAEHGLGSRREIEQWIAQGEILVNGEVATLGQKVLPQDKVVVRGQLLRLGKVKKSLPLIILYHKPPGEIVSKDDPKGRPSVFDKLPLSRRRRLIAIGRLDFNTSGLLMFTDDGQLADFLLHPRQEWEREYAVRIFGEVNDGMLKNLQTGVVLEDGIARFHQIDFAGGEGKNQWYRVIVKEGRYREVRRLWESQGVTVSRLIRIRFANQVLPPHLKQGEWLRLTDNEVKLFLKNHHYSANSFTRQQRSVKAEVSQSRKKAFFAERFSQNTTEPSYAPRPQRPTAQSPIGRPTSRLRRRRDN
jgi:23S rRNA pseudouridine2605 synthase